MSFLRMSLHSSAAVSILLAAAVASAGVVISEVDYDQIGTDTAEWVELHNPDGVPQSLADLELVHQNGATCAEVWRLDLDPITIPAGGYVVIGNHPCADSQVPLPGASNQIQNGAPDIVYIEHRISGSQVDSVEYEQAGASACPPKTTTEAADSNGVDGSIQLCSGAWLFSTTITPCAANDCPVPTDTESWGTVKSDYGH